jgi:hypothetical protein
MKKVRVEDAVGTVLAHDMTRIVPGQFKGVGFKKGHIVAVDDIPELLKLGKRHLYVLEVAENTLHEDEAALAIAETISGESVRWTQPSEGKSSLIARCSGLLKINVKALLRINKLGNIIVSTRRTDFACRKDQVVAATRIIPLTIARSKIDRLIAIAAKSGPVVEVMPFRKMRVGAVVTGSELADGLIADEFDRYVGSKIEAYGSRVVRKTLVTDDSKQIAGAVARMVKDGCELVVTTGGLSVDPDDVTRLGIRKAGAKIFFYGTPVLPGAMFLYAQLDGVPIMGLPACVYFHPSTLFDLLLPRVLAGDPVDRNTVAALGHGGLCLDCEECRFPVCPFGR